MTEALGVAGELACEYGAECELVGDKPKFCTRISFLSHKSDKEKTGWESRRLIPAEGIGQVNEEEPLSWSTISQNCFS